MLSKHQYSSSTIDYLYQQKNTGSVFILLKNELVEEYYLQRFHAYCYAQNGLIEILFDSESKIICKKTQHNEVRAKVIISKSL